MPRGGDELHLIISLPVKRKKREEGKKKVTFSPSCSGRRVVVSLNSIR